MVWSKTEKVSITIELCIFEFSLGNEFELKLTILIFWINIAQKKVFSVKNGKSEHHHCILHIQISMSTKFELKPTIWIFWTKFTQKMVFLIEKRN